MSKPVLLGADAVSLLCSLLEAEEPVITGYAVDSLSMAAAPLIEHGLLVPAGYDDVISVDSDGQEELVSLFPIDDDGTLGYLDRYAGFVAVPPERLLRRRVDVLKALLHLGALFDIPPTHRPVEIVEGLCWDMGNARFAKRPERNSVWFARCLWDAITREQMQTMLERRPHIQPRLILTSGASSAWGSNAPANTLTISVRDAIQHSESLAVDPEIVAARLGGKGPVRATADVHLSEDGTRLTLAREHVFVFRGREQIEAVKRLVAAHARGEPIRAADLTPHGSPRRAFGKVHWPRLSVFMKSGPGGWRLEV